MIPPRHSHPEREAIDTAAADWLLAHDRGLTPAEEAEFGRWINESHLHAQAWQESLAAWSTLDGLAELPDAVARRGADWHVVTPATAAAGETPPARERKLFFRRASLPWAAAALVALGTAGWWAAPDRAPTVLAEAPVIARVQTVAPRQLVLSDGSRVELNAGGEIVEEFTAAERHLRLVRGEAHFTVTKDPLRPFVVDVSGVSVRAVGTAFNVKLADAAVEVLVTEGTVRLDETRAGAVIPRNSEEIAPDNSFLDAGRRAVIPLASSAAATPVVISTVSEAEMRQALAWQAVRLKFVDLTLDRVAAEFNRLNATQLIVDPSARDTLVAGTFRADNVAVFVDFMESAFALVAKRRDDGTIVLSKAR